MDKTKYIKPDEVVKILGITKTTLSSWRLRKKYINYKKLGGKVLYDIEDVLKFLNNSEIKVTD